MKTIIPILFLTASIVCGQTTIKPITQANIEAAITDDPAFQTAIGGTTTGKSLFGATNSTTARTTLELGTAATLDDVDPTKINPGAITRIAGAGDSITAHGVPSGTFQSVWFTYALMSSEKEIPLAMNGTSINFAVGGHTTANWLATQVPAITALGTKPSHVLNMIGTNDVAVNVSIPVAITNVRSGITAFRAAGIEPIFVTIAPAPNFNSINRSVLASQVEIYNNALIDLCAELRVLIVDCRKVGEIPGVAGACYPGVLSDSESPWLGIHPQASWHVGVGKVVGKILNKYSTSPSIWDFDIVNAEPGWDTTTPTVYAGTYQTGTTSKAARADGAGGNILQVLLSKSTVKQIGSGNSGFSFTSVAPNTEADYEVHVFRPPVFGSSNPVPGTPYVTVQPIMGTSRRLILVKLEATASYVTTSTALSVINAINAHPVASTICTAASTGTPGATISTFGSTYDGSFFSSIAPASPEGTVAGTDYIRGVLELWIPRGGCVAGITLFALVAPTTPASLTQGLYHWPLPMPEGRIVLYTPWVLASTSRRLYVTTYFGQADGVYRFGRCEIQRKSP